MYFRIGNSLRSIFFFSSRFSTNMFALSLSLSRSLSRPASVVFLLVQTLNLRLHRSGIFLINKISKENEQSETAE